jgi:hypothetical protein
MRARASTGAAAVGYRLRPVARFRERSARSIPAARW